MDRLGYKWIFAVAGLMVIASLFFALKYGVAPRAVPLIKATAVDSLEEAGVLVYRRLRQDIRAQKIIIAGSLPGQMSYEKFWQGFVLGAQNDGANISKVLAVSGMVPFRESRVMRYEEVSLDSIISRALKRDSKKANGRQLFYLPTTVMSHLNHKGLSESLDQAQVSRVSIALHTFPATSEQISVSCPAKSEESFLKKMDCLGAKVTHDNYRKKVDPTKKYITLYRYGRFDYIAFWYQARAGGPPR